MWLIRDSNQGTVCSVDNKDYLPSHGRLSPNDRLTVSQVRVTHFTNRSWWTVSQLSTNDYPIVSNGQLMQNRLPNPKDSRPIEKKRYSLSFIIFLQPVYSKKQLKSHTKSADCRPTISQFASLTVRRQSVRSM